MIALLYPVTIDLPLYDSSVVSIGHPVTNVSIGGALAFQSDNSSF
jgi:hypothetical protein